MININTELASLNAERRAIRLDYENREKAVRLKYLAEMNAEIDLIRSEKNSKIDATYRKQDELVAQYRKEKLEFYVALEVEPLRIIKER